MTVGRLLKNRFILEEVIESCSNWQIYKALDLRAQEAQAPNPYVAIKLVDADRIRDDPAGMFLTLAYEAVWTRGLSHPNILSALDFDKQGETVYVLLPLLNGQTLAQNASLDPLQIVDGICEALTCIHGHGFMHLNINPQRIFMSICDTPLLTDFTSARGIEATGVVDERVKAHGIASPVYASAELLAGEAPTPAADVYSLAVVLYELYAGKHPYGGLPADQAILRGLKPEAITQLEQGQWQGLSKALALKREDRLQSADELRKALSGVNQRA